MAVPSFALWLTFCTLSAAPSPLLPGSPLRAAGSGSPLRLPFWLLDSGSPLRAAGSPLRLWLWLLDSRAS